MKWKEMYPLKYINDQKLRPNYILERIYELTKGNAIITTEVGQNQLWAAQIYKYSFPRVSKELRKFLALDKTGLANFI